MSADGGAVRTEVAGGFDGPLAFSQVHEDPSVELAAFAPLLPGGRFIGISSGGCTALSLLAAGAEEVVAVDANRTQNHHVELLDLALRLLPRSEALGFVGARRAGQPERQSAWRALAPRLTAPAYRFWQAHTNGLARGIVRAGRTERSMTALAPVLRYLLGNPAGIAALLACRTAEEQARVFDQRVGTRRWRRGLELLLNPVTCRPMYRQFFDNIDAGAFTASMRDGITAAFREVPIWQNWYLHQLLEGSYRLDALPPQLADPDPANWGRLDLVDGDITALLASTTPGSVAGVWLSNVGEWQTEERFAGLLAAAAAAAGEGGLIVWKNFIPRDQPIPARVADRFERLPVPAVTDRSLIRYQRVLCRVRPAGDRG